MTLARGYAMARHRLALVFETEENTSIRFYDIFTPTSLHGFIQSYSDISGNKL